MVCTEKRFNNQGYKERNGTNPSNLITQISKVPPTKLTSPNTNVFILYIASFLYHGSPFTSWQPKTRGNYSTIHLTYRCVTDNTIWLKARRALAYKHSNLRAGKHNQFFLSVTIRFKSIMLTLFSNMNL